MNEQFAEIFERFKNSFNLSSNGYEDPITLEDNDIGFSAKKDIEIKFNKKLKITENKKYLTLIQVLVRDLKKSKAPISLSFDFVMKEQNEYVLGYSYIKNYFRPLNIDSVDEYFYEPEKNIFYKKDKEIAADKILKNLYDLQMKPLKFFKGFKLRSKILLFKFISFMFYVIHNFLKFLLLVISGEIFIYDYLEELVTVNMKNFQQKKLIENSEMKSKKIKIFDYEANIWSIFVFCTFHLLAFFILYFFKIMPNFIKILLKYNFLTIIYVLFALAVFDKLLPLLLKFLIKFSSKNEFDFKYIKLKI